MAVAGASQYRSAAMLSNQRGLSPSIPTLLNENTASLLDVGRGINNIPGIGLSASARFMNKQLLENNSSMFNSLFSLAAGADGTISGAQQQILALRARLPESQLSSTVRGETVDEEA